MTDSKHSILIVDDDSFLLDMYALKFREHGFLVRTALEGTHILEKIEKDSFEPEVILLDLVMPIVDGYELLEKIHEGDNTKHTTVIVFSNLSEKNYIQRAKDLGADGYIVKASATPSEVVERVMSIVHDPTSEESVEFSR